MDAILQDTPFRVGQHHRAPSGTQRLCRLMAQPWLFLVHRAPEWRQRKCQLPWWFGNFPEYKAPATKIPQPRKTQH